MERISPMTRLALDERPGMIRSLASLDIPIDYPFAQTIAYGRGAARVPVKAPRMRSARNAYGIWSSTHIAAHWIRNRSANTRHWPMWKSTRINSPAMPLTSSAKAGASPHCLPLPAHRTDCWLMVKASLIPAGLTDGRCADAETICRRCIRRPSDGLTDEERARVYDA